MYLSYSSTWLSIASDYKQVWPNLTLPNLISIPYPNPARGQPPPNNILSKDLYFLHLMPDDFFKKLPRFGWINIGTAKVHKCHK